MIWAISSCTPPIHRHQPNWWRTMLLLASKQFCCREFTRCYVYSMDDKAKGEPGMAKQHIQDFYLKKYYFPLFMCGYRQPNPTRAWILGPESREKNKKSWRLLHSTNFQTLRTLACASNRLSQLIVDWQKISRQQRVHINKVCINHCIYIILTTRAYDLSSILSKHLFFAPRRTKWTYSCWPSLDIKSHIVQILILNPKSAKTSKPLESCST